MDAKNRQTLGIVFVAALIAFLIALIPTCGQAAEPFDAKAAQLAYDRFDDACNKRDMRACNSTEWQKISISLSNAGWLAYPDHVWIQQDQLNRLLSWVRAAEMHAETDLYMTYNERFAILAKFKTLMSVPQLAVWWRINRETIQEMYPGVWAVMSEPMAGVVSEYAHSPHYETF